MRVRSALLSLNRHSGGLLLKAYSHLVPAFFRASGALISEARANRYCPCCDTKLLAWRTAGLSQKPNQYDSRRYAGMPQDVLCPVCVSLPRHRILAWHLGQSPELLRGKRVLHFAPEKGLALWLRRQGVDVTTADLYHAADLRLDLTDIDLPDESYDVVICNHVLEHVGNYQSALSELRRVLRPGGLLICSFPLDLSYETVDEDPAITNPQERVARFGQHDHLRVFGADSARLLAGAGFRVEVAHGANCPERIRPVTGPANYDSPDIFFCWKS